MGHAKRQGWQLTPANAVEERAEGITWNTNLNFKAVWLVVLMCCLVAVSFSKVGTFSSLKMIYYFALE